MKKNGFTLIELFVVLTIAALFFILAIPNYIADQHKMDAQLARQQLFLVGGCVRNAILSIPFH